MIVIGVDPHKRTHTAVAASEVGSAVDDCTVVARERGLVALLGWAKELGDPDRVWAIEDCRHVAEPLVRYLLDRGERVVRVPPKLMAGARRSARQRGKSDPIDALSVARAALREPGLPLAQIDELAREIRLLCDHRDDLVQERTRVQNRLRWLLHDLNPDWDVPLRRMDSDKWMQPISRRLARLAQTAQVRVCRDLVRRNRELTRAERALDREIHDLTAQRNPNLRAIEGCGAQTAATIVGHVAGISRLARDPQLAMLSGTAPLDASSGKQQRHRLNRGGDRRLNCALHRIAVTQLQRPDSEGRRYVDRRISEGKTKTEAIRCLKRHIARRVHRALQADLKLLQQQEEPMNPRPLTPTPSALCA